MTYHPAGIITIRNRDFPVTVDDSGTWRAEFDGGVLTSGTKENLRAALQRAINRKSVKVAVPFSIISRTVGGGGVQVRTGVATGIHAKNNSLLVRWDDNGKADQLTPYSTYLIALTPAERAEWRTLHTAAFDAKRALAEFERDHALNLRNAVQDEITKAVTG